MFTAPNVFTALNNFHKEARCNNAHTVYYNAGHNTEKKCLRKEVQNKD
jgi:hypothetical protein